MGETPAEGDPRCWNCWYALAGSELERTEGRCPECGKENLPGDARLAPVYARPWPSWPVMALHALWPGMTAVVVAAGVALAVEVFGDVSFEMMPFIVVGYLLMGCVGWGLAWADLAVYRRAPARRAGRLYAALAAGAMAANLSLLVAALFTATVVAWVLG